MSRIFITPFFLSSCVLCRASPHPILIYVMRQIQIRAESGRGFLVNLLHGLATLISLRLFQSASHEPRIAQPARFVVHAPFVPPLRTDRHLTILSRSCRSRAGTARSAIIEPAHTRVASGADDVCGCDRRRGLCSVDNATCAGHRTP